MQSVEITADGIAWTGAGIISGLLLDAGSANASAVFYDNVAASGTVIATLRAPANDSRNFPLTDPIIVDNGVYVDITGAGSPKAYVQIE